MILLDFVKEFAPETGPETTRTMSFVYIAPCYNQWMHGNWNPV